MAPASAGAAPAARATGAALASVGCPGCLPLRRDTLDDGARVVAAVAQALEHPRHMGRTPVDTRAAGAAGEALLGAVDVDGDPVAHRLRRHLLGEGVAAQAAAEERLGGQGQAALAQDLRDLIAQVVAPDKDM